jgi:hypothetical protein
VAEIAASFRKGSGEVLDYQIDWATLLGTDTIATSAWVVGAGLTKDSDTNSTTTTTVWLSGGTVGTDYECENTITTAEGRTHQRTLGVQVIDR